MRIGIFGGTFDPVHVGHLRAAEEIRELYLLDKVYFVPACIPPHKRARKITDPALRLKMLKAAIRGNGFLYTSDIEIKSGGVSYSINTIKVFEKRFKKIYFIVGVDAFSEIDTWHNYREIFSHTNFIIMGRPSNGRKGAREMFPPDIRKEISRVDGNTFEHTSGKRIHLQHVTQLDISSTDIRELTGVGRSIKYLIPRQVEKIIDKEKLYRN
jgi:nicotinate-nucleotide adenylyltransferase